MVCEMGGELCTEMEIEGLPSMWPEDFAAGKQFNIEKPGLDQDMLEEVTIIEEPSRVDYKRLLELTHYSERGSNQMGYLVKHWEYKQANAVRLLNEELDVLSKQRQEVELKKLEILEQHRFEEEKYPGDKRPVSILDEGYDIWESIPCRKNDVVVHSRKIEKDPEYDTVNYWKQHAKKLENMLEESIQREQTLEEKLQESIHNLARQSSPVEELSQILKRADNFLHFVLLNAPVVIGHQDKELRYRFIYNHFPSLQEEDIIGKTDVEIFTGAGVKESQDFKREVLERGIPAKREITFKTDLFGSKTFLIYVEPVFSKSGETIGVNYMGMEITDQVIKREKMAKLREEIAVQKAMETELNKTIHITEETMRAKQMLATMSHEIRSPLTGVVSMTEILANTKLDREQRQLLDVMLSSGDLVLQLINDILDLSKVESGVMKLEATKFRPREVVKHVLQTAAASLQKELTLEGRVSDDVPVEVIGDVLRIRQILTNLISNAIKFTHEGKVGINLYVVSEQCCRRDKDCSQKLMEDQSQSSTSDPNEQYPSIPQNSCSQETAHRQTDNGYQNQFNCLDDAGTSTQVPDSLDEDTEKHQHLQDTIVWLRCDVYDTGIGIPEKALPTLFKKYMQVSADHARKYGGTGLGLAICKQLVELMGGNLTVTTREHCGSTFTFVLPCKVSHKQVDLDDSDEPVQGTISDANTEDTNVGYFQFQPRALGSLVSSGGSRTNILASNKIMPNAFSKLNGLSEAAYLFPSSNSIPRVTASLDDACSISDTAETSTEVESYARQGVHLDNTKSSRRGDGDNDERQGQPMGDLHGCNSDSGAVQSAISSQQFQTPCVEPGNMDERSNNKNREHENSGGSFADMHRTHSEPLKSQLKPKILLVEDNKINVMVTQSMMKQLGHSIDVVNNGLEAIHAVQSCRYDLILMDVCMPVMDGLQATRLIRSFEETGNWDAAAEAGVVPPCSTVPYDPDEGPSQKRIPIIAMTANALSESAAECHANGMDSFVAKPVTFQNLRHCLQQYLTS